MEFMMPLKPYDEFDKATFDEKLDKIKAMNELERLQAINDATEEEANKIRLIFIPPCYSD